MNIHAPADALEFNRSHGFLFLKLGNALPLRITPKRKQKKNDPSRGMPVIICAWSREGCGTFEVTHQSLN
jgi:hypothetical protein